MSERKNLKWICRRCVKAEFENPDTIMVIEKDTHLVKKCSFCGTETWCFLVAASRLVKGKKTDLIVEDDIAEVVESKPPSEVTAEEESVEVVEAIEEAIEEAVEAELEVEEQREESPEETAPAEAVEPTEEEAVAPSPEEEAAVAKSAKITALEAELEALTK